MKQKIKTFLLGKDGETDGRQDSLACNEEKGLFAVADGVSNSFHPEIVARSLCDLFITIDDEALDSWNNYSEGFLLPHVKRIWKIFVINHLQSLSGRILRHEQYNYETWKNGASTFCGVNINREKGILKYFIIGDSTLFIITKEGEVLEYNSFTNGMINIGQKTTIYSNTTEAVISDGTLEGRWFIGEIPLENIASLLLMTDGMAKWFQKHHKENLAPEDALWKLKSHEDFCSLVTNARNNGDMDDDLAVIMVRFISDEETSVNHLKEMSICDSEIEISENSNHEFVKLEYDESKRISLDGQINKMLKDDLINEEIATSDESIEDTNNKKNQDVNRHVEDSTFHGVCKKIFQELNEVLFYSKCRQPIINERKSCDTINMDICECQSEDLTCPTSDSYKEIVTQNHSDNTKDESLVSNEKKIFLSNIWKFLTKKQ